MRPGSVVDDDINIDMTDNDKDDASDDDNLNHGTNGDVAKAKGQGHGQGHGHGHGQGQGQEGGTRTRTGTRAREGDINGDINKHDKKYAFRYDFTSRSLFTVGDKHQVIPLKGSLFLCTGAVCLVSCGVVHLDRQLRCSSIVLYNITNIIYNHHTHNNPLLNIKYKI